jgi:hypothetical protein
MLQLLSDPTSFKDIASGIQSFVIVAAVLFGGVWSLYTFRALAARERAKADLFRQAVLNIRVKATQIRPPNQNGLYVSALATVINSGNRNTFLDFQERSPFSISKVSFDEHGRKTESDPDYLIMDWEHTVVRAGNHQRFLTAGRVPEPGMYKIEFAVELSQDEHVIYAASLPEQFGEKSQEQKTVPYSDNGGQFYLGWTLVMIALGLIALAASVYLVYVLEIVKFRRRRPHATDEEVAHELETGEFEALDSDRIP